MPALATIPPKRRPELVVRALGDDGQHVVKDTCQGAYYRLGPQEAFLLEQLDGQQSAAQICTAFQARFGEPLSEAELNAFVSLVRSWNLLQPDEQPARRAGEGCSIPNAASDPGPAQPACSAAPPARSWTFPNLLYWRHRLADPDRLFTWLAPKLRFVWTWPFLVMSAASILIAMVVAYTNRHELTSSFSQSLRWETAVYFWFIVFVVTLCHECAHGLTCKHFGGEVHEVGLLLLLGMPCFYCNVSDAWLLREKAKRLWVTLAGGYCDLVLWALAVCMWRLTPPDVPMHALAWVVLSVCGGRVFFNFNPLVKLDGYYVLSDLLEMPNLQARARAYLTAHMRWLLWGAPRPVREARGRLLLGYGLGNWVFALGFLTLMVGGVAVLLNRAGGGAGLACGLLLGGLVLYGLFREVFGGEVRTMISKRPGRTKLWALALGLLPPALCLLEWEDRATGSFQLRSTTRTEVPVPVTGFLVTVLRDEGERVYAGQPVAQLEVPNLPTRLAQKQAELRECQARLRLLEAGPRVEEIDAQRQRVERARVWRDLARQDLERARQALGADLTRLEKQIAQHRAELDFAQGSHARSSVLVSRGAVALQHHEEAEKKNRVTRAQLQQAEAQRRSLYAVGTRDSETELSRREKELAEALAALILLEAGTRPEEIEAEHARRDRVRAELRYLNELEAQRTVLSRVEGVITTPRFRECIGRHYREGELLCVVEEPGLLEVDIRLGEKEIARVRPGQAVELKVQGLVLQTFRATVSRLAPRAEPGAVQSSVAVACSLENPSPDLRAGMTGHARIYTGPRPIGMILLDRLLRLVRPEFW